MALQLWSVAIVFRCRLHARIPGMPAGGRGDSTASARATPTAPVALVPWGARPGCPRDNQAADSVQWKQLFFKLERQRTAWSAPRLSGDNERANKDALETACLTAKGLCVLLGRTGT